MKKTKPKIKRSVYPTEPLAFNEWALYIKETIIKNTQINTK